MQIPELQQKIQQFIQQHQQDMLQDLASLIEIPSVAVGALPGKPYGEAPHKALLQARTIAERLGFATKLADDACLMAEYGDRPIRLGLLAHLDVVDAGAGWTKVPYALTQEDGLLYGRGVADDKGPAVALLYAMKAARELRPDLPYGPQVWLGTAEEIGSPDMKTYLKHHKMPKYCLTPDSTHPIANGESAKHRPAFWADWERSDARPQVIRLQGGKVRNSIPGLAEATVAGLCCSDAQAAALACTGQTGVAFELTDTDEGLQIRAVGCVAHISKPKEGRNAQTALVTLLSRLPLADCPGTQALRKLAKLFPFGDWTGAALGLTVHDDIMGPCSVNCTVCQMDETGIRCKFDSRGPTNATPENYAHVIDRTLRGAGFTVEDAQMDPAHYVPESEPMVQMVKEQYQQVFGCEARCAFNFGASYAHFIDGAFATGRAAPGYDTRVHGADECLLLADLLRTVELYIRLILRLCGE